MKTAVKKMGAEAGLNLKAGVVDVNLGVPADYSLFIQRGQIFFSAFLLPFRLFKLALLEGDFPLIFLNFA